MAGSLGTRRPSTRIPAVQLPRCRFQRRGQSLRRVRRRCRFRDDIAGVDESHSSPLRPESAAEAVNTHSESKPLLDDDLGRTVAASSTTGSVWQDVKPLLAFSAQTLCIAVTNPLLSLVDTSVVGLTSETQLAAMAPATAISDGLSYCLTFIPIAVTNLVSLHMARGHPRRAGIIVSDALAIAAALCGALTIALLVGAPAILSRLADMGPDMLGHASDYVRIRALGLPLAVGYNIMQGCFLACRAPRLPMMATVIAGTVNLFGDLLLCQGFGMGVRGAAAATTAANWLVFAIMLRAIQRPLPRFTAYEGVRVPLRAVLPKIQAAWSFLRIAGPVLGVIVVKVLLFGMISAAAAEASSTAAAGHQILFTLALFFGTFGDTVCQAAQSFLPPFIGRPRAAWRLAKSLMLCGALIAAFNGVVGSLAVAYGVGAFSSSAAVAAAVGATAPLFTVQVVLHCCSMGTEGILLAARESAFLCASYIAILAMLKVLLGRLMAQGWGLQGCWICAVAFQAIRLVLNSGRLLRNGSVLSQTSALSDAPTPALAEELAGSSGSSSGHEDDVSDGTSDAAAMAQ